MRCTALASLLLATTLPSAVEAIKGYDGSPPPAFSAGRQATPRDPGSRGSGYSWQRPPPGSHLSARAGNSTDKSTSLWLISDEYKGSTFFDRWDFWAQVDPTHGTVNYVNRSTAFATNLSRVMDNGQVMMKGDDTTTLQYGEYRNSVRISSQKKYSSGSLFILDVDKAPWGCGVWPAWWTVGDNWPYGGEIDILEGVHDNEHNQIAWHTAPGCNYTVNATYTGQLKSVNGQSNTECNAFINDNAGCGVMEWSRASYGPYFEQQGGGVYVMKWDNNSISVWTFYRSAVPEDITIGRPNPDNWGPPSAILTKDNCDIAKFFANHVIVFNITFCGDWAGNSYSSVCPGTCAERIMAPQNFVNATWLINSLHVYTKTTINGTIQRKNDAVAVAVSWSKASLALLMGMLTMVMFV